MELLSKGKQFTLKEKSAMLQFSRLCVVLRWWNCLWIQRVWSLWFQIPPPSSPSSTLSILSCFHWLRPDLDTISPGSQTKQNHPGVCPRLCAFACLHTCVCVCVFVLLRHLHVCQRVSGGDELEMSVDGCGLCIPNLIIFCLSLNMPKHTHTYT